jgi:hypothetical protein
MVSRFCMTEREMVSKQMVVAYFQVLPQKGTEQNHETLCTAGLRALPSMKLAWLTTALHCIGSTCVVLSVRLNGTHQLRPAGSHLSEFRLGCNRCILLRILKSRDTKKLVQQANGSLSASLFTYVPFLFFFSVLHFLFICGV